MIEELNSTDRLEGESDFEYKLRLCSLKLNKEIDLDWSEIVEILGLTISGDHLRKLSYGYKECEQYLKDTRYIEPETLAAHIERENISSPENIIHLSEEEDNIQVIDMGDKFHIYNKKRSIVIDKEKVKKIKEVYCDKTPLTINELCRKLDIARRDFMLLKQGLSICHSDVPYLDEDIQDDNLGDLVVETLERRKEKYFLKLQQEEIKQMEVELSKYRKQDYLFDKIIEKLCNITIKPVKYAIEIQKPFKKREALLNIADIHGGIKFSNYWGSYNTQIARDRFNQLTIETIQTCAELGISNLHVSNLGDAISGIIHQTIQKENELSIEDQVPFVTELIGKMLMEFSIMFDTVIYSSVIGNHGRIFPNKNDCEEKENFEAFISWGLKLMLKDCENVIFEENVIDDGIIVKSIQGVKIYQVHGHLDTFAKVATDLGLMLGKSDECHLAHYHHNKAEEFHEVEVFMSRSFAGIDTYAKNKRLTSTPGQRLYVYSEGKREFIKDIEFNDN